MLHASFSGVRLWLALLREFTLAGGALFIGGQERPDAGARGSRFSLRPYCIASKLRESRESLRPKTSLSDHWRMTKRSMAVSVKMTPEDFALMKKAAAHLWPGAPLTHSTM